MIRIKNLNFGYAGGRRLFEQLSLTLEKGKVYGLLGKNGTGKSSLLKIMAGFLFPEAGDISINNHIPSARNAQLLKNMFFLNEDAVLEPLPIRTYLNAYAPFYPNFDKEKFYHLLEQFNVDKNKHTRKLSFGQQKKLLLSFALSTNVEYLFFDEPTNGMDIPSKVQLRKIVAANISENQTLIIATHQIRDLSNLLDTVVIIDQGKIILSKEIFEIEDKILFTLSPSQNIGREYFYQETIPGGFVYLSENEDALPSKIDMEVFFNAVLENKALFSKILK